MQFLITLTLAAAIFAQDDAPNSFNTWRKLYTSEPNSRGVVTTWYVQDVRQPAGAKYRRLYIKLIEDPNYNPERLKVTHAVEEFDCATAHIRTIEFSYSTGKKAPPSDPSWREVEEGTVFELLHKYACRDRSKDPK